MHTMTMTQNIQLSRNFRELEKNFREGFQHNTHGFHS